MNRHLSNSKNATRKVRFYSSMKSPCVPCVKVNIMVFAVLAIILVCTSCGNGSKPQSYKTCQEAVNAYSSYLSEVRGKKDLTSDKLFTEVGRWRDLRDSVVSCLSRDTVSALHQNWNQTFHMLHDSLRKEFCRIIFMKPRTYTDVLQMKEVTSPYMQYKDLKQARLEAQPFFDSLDNTPVYSSTLTTLLDRYGNFLTQVKSKGIHNKNDLLDFIREEDRLFRSFLSHLSETEKQDMQNIIQETEECCLQVFHSADDKKLSYHDALVYMTIRTNRRLILNASQCVDDVKTGKVKNDRNAQAYLWMLVLPYTSIDGLSIAVLPDKDRKLIYNIAEETPATIERLGKITQMDNERMKELPALFMKIIVTTF